VSDEAAKLPFGLEPDEVKVAREVAESELRRFAKLMALNLDESTRPKEIKVTFQIGKDRVIEAMMRGSLIIDSSGQPVFTPQADKGGVITLHEPKGSTFIAMQSKENNSEASFEALADCTEQPASRFAKMPQRDLKVLQAIQSLFLG
jgi:hypothetical protein